MLKLILFKISVTECKDPPEQVATSWQIYDSPLGDGRLFSGAQINYTCDFFYVFFPTKSHILTCQDDGSWIPALPSDCVQSNSLFINFFLLDLNFRL